MRTSPPPSPPTAEVNKVNGNGNEHANTNRGDGCELRWKWKSHEFLSINPLLVGSIQLFCFQMRMQNIYMDVRVCECEWVVCGSTCHFLSLCVFYTFILNAGGLLFFMAFCLAMMFRNFDEIWRRKRIIRARLCVYALACCLVVCGAYARMYTIILLLYVWTILCLLSFS